MLSEVIFSGTGPLTGGQQIPFTSPVDGAPVLFYLSASGFTKSAPTMLSIQMLVDDNAISSAQVFVNESGAYRSLVCFVQTTTLSYGPHTLSLEPSSSFLSDANCTFNITMVY